MYVTCVAGNMTQRWVCQRLASLQAQRLKTFQMILSVHYAEWGKISFLRWNKVLCGFICF